MVLSKDYTEYNRDDIIQAIRKLAAFQNPSFVRSLWQVVNSFIPYIVLWYLAYRAFEYSFWASLPFSILAGGFLVRIFIIGHDCGHQSYFKSSKANNIMGVITGLFTFTPYNFWRFSHAKHHGTSGNLDKRGFGDITMMTSREYNEATKGTRLFYRLYRNPLVMFLLGPLLIILIKNRIPPKGASRKDKLSIYALDIAIIIMAASLSLTIGFKAYLTIQLSIIYLSHIVGIWLFYVQHQFDGVYWARDKDWDFVKASINGASFYKLPSILNWFTGNIGYHHIHHLNSGIPNYNLPRCHKEIPQLTAVKPITLFSSFKSLKYRLWDEDNGRLIGFKEAIAAG